MNTAADRQSRRRFLHTSALTAGAAISAPAVFAGEKKATSSETLCKTLFDSLDDKQRETLVFKFDDPLRLKVDNNWHITKPTLNKFMKPDQQEMVKGIFMGLHSEEYAEKVYGQVEHDSGKAGFMGGSSIAFFGDPGSEKFEFVLTGRHCTRRCDGNSVEGSAFGGPIFYGHAAESFDEKPTHPGNVYWYQAKRANELFDSLDKDQRMEALIRENGPRERGTKTVALTGKTEGLRGIAVSDMNEDQKKLARAVVRDVLAPFRKEDAKETMKLIEKGGFDNLHLSYYEKNDVGDDGVWDVWKIEGPAMVSYFRGDPHVHAWLHVRDPESLKG